MKQKEALNILKAGKNVYLTGAAGSGKTYVLNEYISYLKHRGVVVGITASTGIAATHIGGVTIHSWSGIGIKDRLSDRDIEYLVQKERLWKRFDRTKVLLIDEVSMLSPALFDGVERVCRAMKRSDKPFGGMQVVLSGDFFQLPPIVRNGLSANTEFINASNAWRNMDVRVCYLSEQFRHNDQSLEQILDEMRSGTVSQNSRALLAAQNGKQFAQGVVPTRLYTHNMDVDILNDEELKKLPGKIYAYPMHTTGKRSMIETMTKSILAPETLKLKKGAAVMFVKNNFEEGYVNGTLGTVVDFKGDTPIVRTFSGKSIAVRTAEWAIEEDGKVLARVEQLPLRLAWAITVHKSQGMSMDAAEIDLSKAFVPGQGYVALSRLRTLAGLVLKGINEKALEIHPEVAHLDLHLRSESEKWIRVIARFDDGEIEKMHSVFIHSCGGTTDERAIRENKKNAGAPATVRVPTHEKTYALVKEGFSLEDIAKKRGLTLGTIISHLEMSKTKDSATDLKKYKPRDFGIIAEVFQKTGTAKLAPAYAMLGGAYSYEELRLARLFLSE